MAEHLKATVLQSMDDDVYTQAVSSFMMVEHQTRGKMATDCDVRCRVPDMRNRHIWQSAAACATDTD